MASSEESEIDHARHAGSNGKRGPDGNSTGGRGGGSADVGNGAAHLRDTLFFQATASTPTGRAPSQRYGGVSLRAALEATDDSPSSASTAAAPSHGHPQQRRHVGDGGGDDFDGNGAEDYDDDYAGDDGGEQDVSPPPLWSVDRLRFLKLTGSLDHFVVSCDASWVLAATMQPQSLPPRVLACTVDNTRLTASIKVPTPLAAAAFSATKSTSSWHDAESAASSTAPSSLPAPLRLPITALVQFDCERVTAGARSSTSVPTATRGPKNDTARDEANVAVDEVELAALTARQLRVACRVERPASALNLSSIKLWRCGVASWN
ncbi:hypothetical protein PTSG_04538 [Salpingoeca rosetta]|uniref:Uncharacterized protein n=1 Tax=Salpingoeca rosetta (strain ATCC 50818 / BSB-021) TaxID=946362 RepID=F2U7Q6_SALR5|nr:uncharacterized protein PTSG_04538 [Salpingoeca rosetta]EGD72811.1 hypothetical protein PTSG_04538 [Salpingoeca rosetta]|eukprot:XP_004994634.1 hypothetical protein PTSG_04538 [Salpingoeca rosetta]